MPGAVSHAEPPTPIPKSATTDRPDSHSPPRATLVEKKEHALAHMPR
jgi:hypothetical protein